MNTNDKKVLKWAVKLILLAIIISAMIIFIPELYNYDSTLFEVLGVILTICGMVIIYFVFRIGEGNEEDRCDNSSDNDCSFDSD